MSEYERIRRATACRQPCNRAPYAVPRSCGLVLDVSTLHSLRGFRRVVPRSRPDDLQRCCVSQPRRLELIMEVRQHSARVRCFLVLAGVLAVWKACAGRLIERLGTSTDDDVAGLVVDQPVDLLEVGLNGRLDSHGGASNTASTLFGIDPQQARSSNTRSRQNVWSRSNRGTAGRGAASEQFLADFALIGSRAMVSQGGSRLPQARDRPHRFGCAREHSVARHQADQSWRYRTGRCVARSNRIPSSGSSITMLLVCASRSRVPCS